MKEAERKAIITGIQDNSADKADIVIKKVLVYIILLHIYFVRQVLEQRHSQELRDLDAQCEAEKVAVLTEALSKLQVQQDEEREKMLSKHEQQMNDLLSKGANLTPEELEERKMQLLNKQQQELKLV